VCKQVTVFTRQILTTMYNWPDVFFYILAKNAVVLFPIIKTNAAARTAPLYVCFYPKPHSKWNDFSCPQKSHRKYFLHPLIATSFRSVNKNHTQSSEAS
jgi:hypothetical protein